MEELKNIQAQANFIRGELRRILANMPDNPEITRIGDGSCFTVMSSAVFDHKNFSPEYYDFKHMYLTISKHLDKVPIENVYNRLKEIVDQGYIILGNRRQAIHPDMINALRQIL